VEASLVVQVMVAPELVMLLAEITESTGGVVSKMVLLTSFE
jgi:hypothetical protein